MKVLLTGFTAKDRGEGRPSVLTLMDGIHKALEWGGHDVERRKVDPYEDLSSFDFAVVSIYDYRGVSATAQKFQSLRVCAELPHVLAWSDWNASKIFKSVRVGRESMMHSGLHSNDERHQLMKADILGRYGHTFARFADDWSKSIPACICPAFMWGQHDKLREKHDFGSLLCWDPSPWIVNYYERPTVLPFTGQWKSKQWVLGSLNNYSEWVESLKLDWKVIDFSKPQSRSRSWQVTEQHIFNWYCSSWGVLSPPYEELMGSGWWRNRWCLAKDAGSILLCDPEEIGVFENSWYYVNQEKLEQMSYDDLADVAQAQANEFETFQLPQSESYSDLIQWLNLRTIGAL